jgi:hypothetical protein
MKLNWDSLIDPIFLFMLYLIAGTLWVIIPFRTQAQPVAPPPPPQPVVSEPAPASEPAPDPAIEKEWDAAARALERLRQQRATLEQESQSVREQQASALEQIRQQDARLAELKAQAANLDQRQSQARSAAEEAARAEEAKRAQADQLRNQAEQKKNEEAKLLIVLQNSKSPYDGGGVSAPQITKSDKQVTWIELLNNRAFPVDAAHYDYALYNLKGGGIARVATRKGGGEGIDEIKSPASAVARYFENIKPKQEFLACLVHSDSFRLYREVRKIAWSRGIEVGWEPIDRTDGKLIFTSAGRGQEVNPQKP